MSKYRLENGTIVDTDRAEKTYEEDTIFNGRNRISKNTGSQWVHEQLYKSRKGYYYLESWSQWQGSIPSARKISDVDAARWLLLNNYSLPEELAEYDAD